MAEFPPRERQRRQFTPIDAADEITLIENSFGLLVEHGDAISARFYERLFTEYPELAPLFENVSQPGQQKKLLASMVLLVQNLRQPEVIEDYLISLGARHQQYGIQAADFEKFSENWLAVLAEFSGESWTSQLEHAWHNLFKKMAALMSPQDEAWETEVMAENVETQTQVDDARMQMAIDNAVTAIMMVDRDGKVIYANPATLNLLRQYEQEISQVNPGFSADQLVGSYIDQFDRNAVFQRSLQTDVRRLPISDEVNIGELVFNVNVSPQLDDNDKHTGNTIEIMDITESSTEQADSDGQLDAIDRAMGVISFKLDGTVIEVNDNFLDVVGYRKDEVVGRHHSMFVSDGYAASNEYSGFWTKLNRGEFVSGEFERISRSGETVWLQATYNPIFDRHKRPVKVIKYAQDITKQKRLQETIEAIFASTSEVMSAMAEGDLTKTIEGEYEGEFAELQQAVNESIRRISEVVEDINESALSVSSAASEISQGNIDLSQRTEEQASSLEETAASMEELTSTVRQNADNTRQANQLATTAREQAEKGGDVIDKAIKAMSEINASSKKVADIIGVIDEIAFQTNLLALNAAVEAARAGEQGRGFAVVASEVRNLAQRSATAAKEIKSLINDSGEKVKEGTTLVDQTGDALEEIVSGAKKVGDIISEISAAGDEQSAGIEEVSTAVTQMDEMTQQNAALVEEAASASEALDEQGKNLQELMAFFNTGKALADVPQARPQTAARQSTRPATASRPQTARKSAASVANHRSQAANANDEEWDEF